MKPLLDAIERYETFWTAAGVSAHIFDAGEQREVAGRFRDFVLTNAECAERTHLPGHLTGSAVVVTQDLSHVLLTLHRKLNRWLQLGGHADGSHDLTEVAMREAREESGLPDLRFVQYAKGDEPLLFDLDIHWIPPRNEPGHYHYDARYLIATSKPDAIAVSDESHELKWFGVAEAFQVTRERSMHRLLEKIAYVRDHCLSRDRSPQGSRFERSM